MRRSRCIAILLAFACSLCLGFSPGAKRLADIYRSGKVRLVQELALDDKSLPKDVLFVGPAGIVFDPKGDIYVLDLSDNNIKKFDASGRFLKVIGSKGQGPGEFNVPTDLAFAKNTLVVLDRGNRRLCALTPGGEFIKAESAASYSGWPERLKALPSGDIVLEAEKFYSGDADKPQDRSLEVLTPDLKPIKTIYSQAVSRTKLLRLQGMKFFAPQPFCADVFWDVSPSGRIIVGFSAKYEIDILAPDGGEISTLTHDYEPVKVTAEEEKSFFAGSFFRTEKGTQLAVPDEIVKNTTFPKFKPAFQALAVDSEGNILVQTYSKNTVDMNRYFDAFDAGGKFIARFHVECETPFPSDWQQARFVDKSIWLIKSGSDELPKVVKCRISG